MRRERALTCVLMVARALAMRILGLHRVDCHRADKAAPPRGNGSRVIEAMSARDAGG